jgi:hypothetical protein
MFSNAQEYNKYIHYSTENGLPTNNIYNGCENKEGFIFFNSSEGLIRYDGYEFKIFTAEDGLLDDDIIFIKNDNLDRLWIVPFNGSICYYKDSKIHNAKNDPFVKKICDVFDKKEFLRISIINDKYISIYQQDNNKFVTILNDSITIYSSPANYAIKSIPLVLNNKDSIYLFTDKYKFTYLHQKLIKTELLNSLCPVNEYYYNYKQNTYSVNYNSINKTPILVKNNISSIYYLKEMNLKKYNIIDKIYQISAKNDILYFSSGANIYQCDTNLGHITKLISLPSNSNISGFFL